MAISPRSRYSIL